MPKIKATFGNSVAKFRRAVASTNKQVAKDIENAINKQAKLLFNQLKGLTRRNTGKLRSGWRLISKGVGKFRRFTIINTVSYGVYTTTNRTASKGGTYLEDALNNLIKVHQNRLNIKVRNILKKPQGRFNAS